MARILPVKVLDCDGNGTFSDLASAITFASDNGARLINMSLGANIGSCPTYLQDAIDHAVVSRGVFVAAAAGNSGDSSVSYPAGCANVVSVGATDNSDVIADFSQHPPTAVDGVDIAAPGVSIASTFRNTTAYGYAQASGTSMATPHLVGCAALIRSVAPFLAPAAVESTLKSTAVDLGSPGWDSAYGAGRVNCASAVGLASSLPTATPSATSTATPLSTQGPTSSATPTPTQGPSATGTPTPSP